MSDRFPISFDERSPDARFMGLNLMTCTSFSIPIISHSDTTVISRVSTWCYHFVYHPQHSYESLYLSYGYENTSIGGWWYCRFFLGGGLQKWKYWGGKSLHPGRLTWNLQITHLERKMIFQTSMIMFHVNLPGCTKRWSMESIRSRSSTAAGPCTAYVPVMVPRQGSWLSCPMTPKHLWTKPDLTWMLGIETSWNTD